MRYAQGSRRGDERQVLMGNNREKVEPKIRQLRSCELTSDDSDLIS